ncbi:MAG: thioredoxin [Fermentimonas sp.]|jgi:thioredoxin
MKNIIRRVLLVLPIVALTIGACSNSGQKSGGSNRESNNLKITNNMSTETGKTIHLTRAEFLEKVVNFEKNPEEWVYLGDKPAIVDFYADWCGPCKMIAPVLEELATEYDGQIYIYKIDTEAEQQLSAEFGIRSIPTLLFVPMDGQPQMSQGALPKNELKKAIDDVLLKKN